MDGHNFKIENGRRWPNEYDCRAECSCGWVGAWMKRGDSLLSIWCMHAMQAVNQSSATLEAAKKLVSETIGNFPERNRLSDAGLSHLAKLEEIAAVLFGTKIIA